MHLAYLEAASTIAAKSGAFKRSSADKSAVDIFLGEQLGGIFGVHGTAVLNGHAVGDFLAVKRGDGGADNSANLVCLLGGGGETCSDCPNGLICDNDIF